MNNPKLSILIITIPDRAEKLARLVAVLRPQIPEDNSVEVLVKEELPVSQGGPTIGANRNAAIEDSVGDYVSFVDDDDLVPEYYVERVLKAIETEPDVVGIEGNYILGVTDILGPRPDTGESFGIVAKNKPELFIHSMQFKEWLTVDGVHQLCPDRLNPVKRELALQVPYTEKNHGEDQDYSMALLPLLKTEVMVDGIMYFYLKC